MRFRIAVATAVLAVLLVGSAHPLHAQEERQYFTLSGGWSWPAGGAVKDNYQSGFTLAGSFRDGLAPNYLGGLEIGYTWYSLDTDKVSQLASGSVSGGNMGLLHITTENDYLFGTTAAPFRPFLNLGIGYYKSFIDDATLTTGSTTDALKVPVYDGSFFGFHGGIGALFNRDRYGIRVDANYVHLFVGGPDYEVFTVRGGIIFYMSGMGMEDEDEG